MCDRTELVPIPQLLWDADAIGRFDPSPGSEYGINDAGERCLAIDACLAPALTALWAAGIVTVGCCCGHGDGGGVISIRSERLAGIEPGSEMVHMRRSMFEWHVEQGAARN